MRLSLKSPHDMKPQGVGPDIFKAAFLTLVAGIVVGIFYPFISRLPIPYLTLYRIAGMVMLLLGCLIYFISVIQFLKEFPKGKLITKGVYSISRNPLYSSWILLILPGLALCFNNWIFLFAAVVMYFSFRKHIGVEEKQLLTIFGAEYINYTQKVRRLFLMPRF